VGLKSYGRVSNYQSSVVRMAGGAGKEIGKAKIYFNE
jgi:hypothetical protein